MTDTTCMNKKEYRQKWMTLKARIKYREQTLAQWKRHLTDGTFPKQIPTIKPYPKMESSHTQASVNEACYDFKKVILTQMIRDVQTKLEDDQNSLQTLKDTRREQRQHKKNAPTVLQLQQELRDLQAQYKQLSQKVEMTSVNQERRDILSE